MSEIDETIEPQDPDTPEVEETVKVTKPKKAAAAKPSPTLPKFYAQAIGKV
jgi:hypothetical protein